MAGLTESIQTQSQRLGEVLGLAQATGIGLINELTRTTPALNDPDSVDLGLLHLTHPDLIDGLTVEQRNLLQTAALSIAGVIVPTEYINRILYPEE